MVSSVGGLVWSVLDLFFLSVDSYVDFDSLDISLSRWSTGEEPGAWAVHGPALIENWYFCAGFD